MGSNPTLRTNRKEVAMSKLKITKMVYGRPMVGTDVYKKNLSSKRSKCSDQKRKRKYRSAAIKTNLTWKQKLIRWFEKIECWFLDYLEEFFG